MTYPSKIDGTIYLDRKDSEDVITLDGSTSQYIIHNPFDFGGVIVKFCFELWIETNDLNNAGTLLSYAVATDFDHILLQDYRDLKLTIRGYSSGSTGIELNDGIPHHVAITWGVGNGVATIYIDGHERWSGMFGKVPLTDDGSLVLGLEQGSVGGTFSNGFVGKMWDARFWADDIRTPDEIFHNMNHRIPTAGLMAYWKLDEGSGTNANDSTTNNRDGIIHGTGVWTTTDVRFFTDVTDYLDLGSFVITSALTNQIDTSEFALENAGAVSPSDWDEVAIYDGALSAATRIFGGYVIDLEESEGEGAGRDFAIGCGDPATYLDHIFVKAEYEDKSDAYIINDLFETYAQQYDVETHVETVKTHDKIRFNRVSLREIMDTLADLAQGDWYVDYERRVHFFVVDIESAPFGISNSPDLTATFPYEKMKIKTDGAGVVNRVEIVGGDYLSGDDTFYLQGTGQDPIIKMPFKMHGPSTGGALDVWRNDGTEAVPSWTVMTVKVGHIDALGGADEVLHYFQEQNLEQQSDWPQLPNAVKIFGRYEVPLRTRVRDQASFKHYKLWFDAVLNDPDIVDKATAKLAGKAIIAEAALSRVDIQCTIREPGCTSGMKIPFTNANASISAVEYFIQRVSASISPGGLVEYDLQLGAYSPDLIDVFIQLARASKSKPIWRDDEVLDELLEHAETLEFTDTTHAPVVTTDPYHWGPSLLLRLPFNGDADDAAGNLVPSTESGAIIYPSHITPQVGSGAVQLAEQAQSLLKNPNAEHGTLGSIPTGWTKETNNSLEKSDDYAYVGSYSAKCTQGGASQYFTFQGDADYEAGESYICSFVARKASGAAITTLEIDSVFIENASVGVPTITAIDGGPWYKIVSGVRVATGGSNNVGFYIDPTHGAGLTIYVGAVMLEKGTYPTPYSDGSLGEGHFWDTPASWDQTADMEEGTLADFDGTSPAWDGAAFFEGNDTSEFDAEVDADGDLNASAASKRYGSYGAEVTFDDANTAYGELNLAAIDQSSAIVKLDFDPNGVTLADTKYIDVCYINGAGTNGVVRLYNSGGQLQLIFYTLNDGAGWDTIATVNVTDDWHEILYYIKVATGAGNNDGIARAFVDGVHGGSSTTLDNDTLDFDKALFGMCATTEAGFGGSFYFDNIMVDTVGAPYVSEAAALSGNYGIAIPVVNTTSKYAAFTDPSAETLVTAECWIDSNSIVMGTGEAFTLIFSSTEFIVYLYYTGSVYRVYILAYTDTGSEVSEHIILTDEPHKVKIIWAAASSVSADDGYALLYIDDIFVSSLSNLDNNTLSVDDIDFGSLGIDSGTYGIFYMDDCRWSDAAGDAHNSTSSRIETELAYSLTAGSKFSVGGWFDPATLETEFGSDAYLLDWYNSANDRIALRYDAAANDLDADLIVNGSSNTVTYSTALVRNEKIHIMLTWDGATFALLVNGVSVGTPASEAGTWGTAPSTLYLGADNAGSKHSNIWLDELIISDYELNSTEVAAIVAETVEKELIALYKEYWETENSKALFNWEFGSWG